MADTFTFSAGERQGAVRYLDALRRHAWLIGGLTLAAVVAASFLTLTAQKRYSANADILLQPVSGSDSTYQGFNSVLSQPLDGSSVVVTAARVINSPQVRQHCIAGLGPLQRGAKITTSPLGQADIVSIDVTALSPAQAAAVANSFAKCVVADRTAAFHAELNSRIRQVELRSNAIPASQRQGNYEYATLQQSLATYNSLLGGDNPSISVLTKAAPPTDASSPRPKLTIGASFLVALLVGSALAILLEFGTSRIAREEELQHEHRLPILARIPRLPRSISKEYLSGQTPLPASGWKGYRVLRASIGTMGEDGHLPRSLLVTSAMPGDGKTTTAINLAITLASTDLHVVLVDGDLHRPMVSGFFGSLRHRDGFSRALSGRTDVSRALVESPKYPNLKLLLSSPESGAFVHTSSADLQRLVEELGALADVVVIDAPPLPEVAEVVEMASVVDTVLIAVRLGHTRRRKLVELREMLARRGITPGGFVVTTREKLREETPYDYPGEALVPLAEQRRVLRAAEDEPEPQSAPNSKW
jgi:capsular exopolysaccharide synthesis family protein